MAFVSSRVFDNGLTVLDTEANRLDICTQKPATYTEATITYTKGNKTGLSVGSPVDRSPSGRKVIVAEITDGTVTGDGTVTYWAITDTVNNRLLATDLLSSEQTVTSGDIFTLIAFDIGIQDALDISLSGQSTGWAYCYNYNGTAEEGVTVQVQQIATPETFSYAFDSTVYTGTSASDGLVQFTGLWIGGTYQARRLNGAWHSFVVPNAASFALPAMLGR